MAVSVTELRSRPPTVQTQGVKPGHDVTPTPPWTIGRVSTTSQGLLSTPPRKPPPLGAINTEYTAADRASLTARASSLADLSSRFAAQIQADAHSPKALCSAAQALAQAMTEQLEVLHAPDLDGPKWRIAAAQFFDAAFALEDLMKVRQPDTAHTMAAHIQVELAHGHKPAAAAAMTAASLAKKAVLSPMSELQVMAPPLAATTLARAAVAAHKTQLCAEAAISAAPDERGPEAARHAIWTAIKAALQDSKITGGQCVWGQLVLHAPEAGGIEHRDNLGLAFDNMVKEKPTANARAAWQWAIHMSLHRTDDDTANHEKAHAIAAQIGIEVERLKLTAAKHADLINMLNEIFKDKFGEALRPKPTDAPIPTLEPGGRQATATTTYVLSPFESKL